MSLSITESENPATRNIDKASILEALSMINAEDKKVADSVEAALPQIAEAVEKIVERVDRGGRLFYVGTGTSGRLGVLDASELPPTFGVDSELVQGVIAGGIDALYKASEASEDNANAGASDLKSRGLGSKDAVIGIAASGRTPYTIGALEFARDLGCFTACITCSPRSPITLSCETPIVAVVGPEVIAGSTRMKAGTAQKLILNMISTVLMVRLGYVSGNRMTNLKASNVKLRERSIRILAAEMEIDLIQARDVFEAAGRDLRTALVMAKANVSRDEANELLTRSKFAVEEAIRLARAQ